MCGILRDSMEVSMCRGSWELLSLVFLAKPVSSGIRSVSTSAELLPSLCALSCHLRPFPLLCLHWLPSVIAFVMCAACLTHIMTLSYGK